MRNKVTFSTWNLLVCLVAATLFVPFVVKAQGNTTQSPAIDDSQIRPPITQADLQIVKRAREILDSPSKWNRLYCALQMATNEVSGKAAHRGAALQEARFVIDEIAAERKYEHRLMNYNNDPTTTFTDIQEVFRIVESLITLRLKANAAK
jgi:hypothetical protein